MKQYFVKRTLIAGLALLTIPAFAQSDKEKEKTKNKEKETEHIVITRTGDNEGKTVIEIDGDKVKVNGKEVEKGKSNGVTVQRHKYSGNAVRVLPRTHDWDFDFDYDNNLSLFSEDANRAMLGVVTDEADKGAKITSITDESAAEKAGLKVGDVITRIDDEDIDGAGDVADAIHDHKPGDKVTVTYLRDGKEQKVTAELGKWKGVKINTLAPTRVMPDVWTPGSGQGFRNIYGGGGQPKLGLQIQDTDDGNGVKVLEVAEESNAAKAGLKEDDVITHIDDKAVNSTDEITRIIRESREKTSVNMQVKRNGKSQKIEVRIPRKIKTTDL